MRKTRNKMKAKRIELIRVNTFLDVIANQYKRDFGKELNILKCAVDEIESEDEVESYYFEENRKLKEENKMLRLDLQELSKEFFNQKQK